MATLFGTSKYISSPLAHEVITEAYEKKHYVFRVVGDYGVITSPMYQDGWWYMPEEELKIDDPIIQNMAIQRVNLIKSITPVKGYIIAHESPKMFCPPKKTWQPPTPSKFNPLKVGKIREMPEIHIDWQTIGQVALATAKVVGVVLLGALYVLAAMASALASVDPKVICVLSDSTWLELGTWYE